MPGRRGQAQGKQPGDSQPWLRGSATLRGEAESARQDLPFPESPALPFLEQPGPRRRGPVLGSAGGAESRGNSGPRVRRAPRRVLPLLGSLLLRLRRRGLGLVRPRGLPSPSGAAAAPRRRGQAARASRWPQPGGLWGRRLIGSGLAAARLTGSQAQQRGQQWPAQAVRPAARPAPPSRRGHPSARPRGTPRSPPRPARAPPARPGWSPRRATPPARPRRPRSPVTQDAGDKSPLGSALETQVGPTPRLRLLLKLG